MKAVINDVQNLVTEMIDGIVSACNGKVQRIEGVNAIIKREIPQGKVILLVGGGSGHEPAYHGLIGRNMADGAAIGNIFASPNPEIIIRCAKSLHQGNGILFLYGNYSGDTMNFDLAAELLEEQGISSKTVLIKDDIAIQDPAKRRGIAGLLLIAKIAGAVCSSVENLEEAARITQKASDHTASMGVAIDSGDMLNTGEKMFQIDTDEIELGLGLHGEPGIKKCHMLSSDELTRILMENIFDNIELRDSDEVALLVNDLGAMTGIELLIINRKVSELLAAKGIKILKTFVGKYSTSMNMRGFSISIMKLDQELKQYFFMSAESLALTVN